MAVIEGKSGIGFLSKAAVDELKKLFFTVEILSTVARRGFSTPPIFLPAKTFINTRQKGIYPK